MNEKLSEKEFIKWIRTKIDAGEQVLIYPVIDKKVAAVSGKIIDWRMFDSKDAVSTVA